MNSVKNQYKLNKNKLESISEDILRPVGFNIKFHIWMAILSVCLIVCFYFYAIQLREGLIVTGMRDYVSWGMYIANFVFFVAASLVGMLITGVLGLIGYSWIKPISRIAEIIAVGFAAVAGLVIVSDMGRPDRLHHVLVFARVQSPILWDITVVTTYLIISILLYFLPLIPDLAIGKNRLKGHPQWLRSTYRLLSLRWTNKPEQFATMFKGIRILIILVIPTAFAIHTVTSWLFAVNSRPGWDSTIFGPYFLTGAFVAGSAALVIAMYFFSTNYKLQNYITEIHFDKMGKLLVLVSIVYLYFNINEFLVPAYKLKAADSIHIKTLFTGHYSIMFWSVQLLGLVIPTILLIIKKARKPLPMLFISIFMLAGSWLKRYIIVVPTMEHPYLPKQFVPGEWMIYKPTLTETFITLGSVILVLFIISVLSKIFPVVPIWEMAGENQEVENK